MPSPKKTPAKALDTPSGVVHVRLPQEAIEKLDKMAERKFTSRNALIQIAISEMLERGSSTPA